MIVVTGATGFIGSNLVRALVGRGQTDLLVVDNIEQGAPLRYLDDLSLPNRVDKNLFLEMVERDDDTLESVDQVFHQGACTDTTERDRDFMMATNLDYSRSVARFCQRHAVPLVYASSAAVYGLGTDAREEPACEAPINEYAESKKLFDDWVRSEILPAPQALIVGLRYFNVYGPRESHKRAMSSVAYKMHGQLAAHGRVKLFEGSHGFADGEQQRDFVHVDDVVAVNLFFLDHPGESGIFNCGTGRATPFNAVARAVIEHAGRGEIEYIPFPDELRDRYQAWTQADLTRLRAVGYDRPFEPVAEGVARYMAWLDEHESD
jgi:ADP-L-glycero-D-manno-heptose 6-epimerase